MEAMQIAAFGNPADAARVVHVPDVGAGAISASSSYPSELSDWEFDRCRNTLSLLSRQ
jgi:hypothetical protein